MLFFEKKNKDDLNRRLYRRHRIYQTTFYRMGDSANNVKNCMIHDISYGGILIELDEDIDIGTNIIVLMNFNGNILQEKVNTIRHNKLLNKKYGCEFTDDSKKEEREEILSTFFENINEKQTEIN